MVLEKFYHNPVPVMQYWMEWVNELRKSTTTHDTTTAKKSTIMMTSSNGNLFRVTGPLCGEFTGDRRIPLTKDTLVCSVIKFVRCWLFLGRISTTLSANYLICRLICIVSAYSTWWQYDLESVKYYGTEARIIGTHLHTVLFNNCDDYRTVSTLMIILAIIIG